MSPPDPAQAADPPGLTVRVRLFAGLREAMGWSEQSVPTPAGATPLHLWQQLDLAGGWQAATGSGAGSGASSGAGSGASSQQGGSGLPDGVRVAINQQFAAADVPLAEGDELAYLPPISGG
jgi:molybdopterin synthase sulfur carrier subunit